MNSPLEHDLEDFSYRASAQLNEETFDGLENIDEEANVESSIENLPKCEICNREFVTKKELRSHVILHLGRPRIVLKRCSGVKSLKKREKETYWLDPDKKGSLKLTLKKHQLHATDALKLTIKKSSATEDFAVVNTNTELERDKENSYEEELEDTETTDNVQMDDKEREEETEQRTFENVIVNEREAFENEEDENYDDEEISNPLEDNEVPSLEANEGDSGVGSDMANPSEREDQNVDEFHAGGERSYDNNQDNNVTEENEDPEDTDALEATCRETIENLKKLGEHSRNMKSMAVWKNVLSQIVLEERAISNSARRTCCLKL